MSYEEAPQLVFDHDKFVVTRKDHPCMVCKHVLPKGTHALKVWHLLDDQDKPDAGYMCRTNYFYDTCMVEAKKAAERYNDSHSE